MDTEKATLIINDTLYSNCPYPHAGNDCVLAANLILRRMGITDIDAICRLAKSIDRNSSLGHGVTPAETERIMRSLRKTVEKYQAKRRADPELHGNPKGKETK